MVPWQGGAFARARGTENVVGEGRVWRAAQKIFAKLIYSNTGREMKRLNLEINFTKTTLLSDLGVEHDQLVVLYSAAPVI